MVKMTIERLAVSRSLALIWAATDLHSYLICRSKLDNLLHFITKIVD